MKSTRYSTATTVASFIAITALGLLMPLAGFADDDQVYLNRAGTFFAQGHYHDAAKFYRKALKVNTTNPYAYLGLGLSLKAQGDIQGAQEVMEKLVSLYPDFAPAYYNLGLILESKGDMVGARGRYKEFIDNSQGKIPEDPGIRIKLRQMGLM